MIIETLAAIFLAVHAAEAVKREREFKAAQEEYEEDFRRRHPAEVAASEPSGNEVSGSD